MRFTKALALWLVLVPALAWAAYPDVAVLDTCVRANEGPPPSASWVNSQPDGLRVLSNVCQSSSSTNVAASTWNTSFGPDMEVAVTLAQQSNSYWALSLRQQTASNFESDHYEIGFQRVAGSNNDEIYVFKDISGVYTQLGATIALGADLAASDTVGARIVSNTITVFRNGASVATRTDSALTGAGYAGVTADPDASTPVHIVDFRAGNWPVASSATGRHRTLLGVGQ